MRTHDVAILGCGPAGIAAAIQLKRMGEEPLVLEASRVGGLLLSANLVENYPGFPDGLSGAELVDRMRLHLERHVPEVLFEEVVRLDYEESFRITTGERELRCPVVLIASGTRPRQPEGLDISGEVKGRVFSEIHPLNSVRERRIAIVGSGDAAFDYAINLAGRNKVTILNRSERPRCLPVLRDRADRIASIGYRARTAPREVKSGDRDTVELKCQSPEGEVTIPADYVLLAIGREPRLDFVGEGLKGRMEGLRKAGLLYLIGDVARGMMRQTAIAVGDGVRAAMSAGEKLKELRG